MKAITYNFGGIDYSGRTKGEIMAKVETDFARMVKPIWVERIGGTILVVAACQYGWGYTLMYTGVDSRQGLLCEGYATQKDALEHAQAHAAQCEYKRKAWAWLQELLPLNVWRQFESYAQWQDRYAHAHDLGWDDDKARDYASDWRQELPTCS